MFTVLVRLEVVPDRISQFLDGIHINAVASLRDEPGCIRFDVQRELGNPLVFHFYEIYASREAFEVDHRNAAHYAKWRTVVTECVVPGTQVNTYAAPPFPADIPEFASVTTDALTGGSRHVVSRTSGERKGRT